MKATIEHLTVKLGTRTIDLTLDEAKQLQQVLNETLTPRNVFPTVIERVVEKEVPFRWPYPHFERDEPTFRPPWMPAITC